MPAKTKKPAVKKPAAKPASKPAPKASVVKSKSKPAVKKPAPKKVAATKPSPKKTAPKKPAPKKPAPKKPSPKPVKKSSPKKAPAKPAPAKKPAAKAVKPAAKKAAAPAKKPATAAKPAAPAKPAKAPAPAPAAPKKTVKEPKKAKTGSKSAPAPITVKGRSTFTTKGILRTSDYEEEGITIEPQKGPVKMTTFLKKQRQRLVDLRDAYLNSIEGVASETIRNENGDASAFGMHQADAGSDAYDRDFALSLLGKEQDALYEINEALKRIETGTYGLCEGTGTKIPEERLEAMPFARYSVAYQEKIERSQISGRWSRPVHSLFGLDSADDAAADDDKDDDDTAPSSKSGESLDFSK